MAIFGMDRARRREGGTLVSLLLCAALSSAQLVNPGFEQAAAMPDAPGMWHLLPGWNNAFSGSATPDFFHLDGSLGGDLPETPVALVQPAEGRGIAGLAAIKRNPPGMPLSREYLVMELATPLEPGQAYSVSFEVTNGLWLSTSPAGLAVNGLGVAFSLEQPIQLGGGRLDLPPTFQFPYARYDDQWERVSFQFEAASPARFMTIGVFGEDAELEADMVMGDNPQLAYYFFDDFTMGPVDLGDEPFPVAEEPKGPDPELPEGESSVFVPNAFSPNGDGLNDYFAPEVGVQKPSSFEIYSRWGQLVAKLDPGAPRWDGRDMSGTLLGPGIYVWKLEWPGGPASAARSEQGAVTILR